MDLGWSTHSTRTARSLQEVFLECNLQLSFKLFQHSHFLLGWIQLTKAMQSKWWYSVLAPIIIRTCTNVWMRTGILIQFGIKTLNIRSLLGNIDYLLYVVHQYYMQLPCPIWLLLNTNWIQWKWISLLRYIFDKTVTKHTHTHSL